MKSTIFWDITQCQQVEVHQCTASIIRVKESENGGNTFPQNTGGLVPPDDMVLHLRRLQDFLKGLK
jgi:hypothetical protein